LDPPGSVPDEEGLVSWFFPAEVPVACCNGFLLFVKLNGRRTRLTSPAVFLPKRQLNLLSNWHRFLFLSAETCTHWVIQLPDVQMNRTDVQMPDEQ